MKISIITLLLITFFTPKSFASEFKTDMTFVVTAYYSPLPDQKAYLKGNYEAEKRLNWEWIAWASWKKVFSWMLAAPKTYRFGTKIYLEWLGIWSVEDRWGAIVSAWNRWYKSDRIDIWMWYWDEWLQRALNWWKREVKWTLVMRNNKTTIDYTNLDSPSWVTKNLKNKAYNKPSKASKVIIKTIITDPYLNILSKPVKTDKEINTLSKLLFILDLNNWELTSDYNDLISIIYDFQLKNNIVKSEYDLWAWSYWPKTRIALKAEYSKYLDREKEKALQIKLTKEAKQKLEKLEIEADKLASDKVKLIWNVKLKDVNPNVRELQVLLREFDYFDEKDTAIFWEKTKKAIMRLQIDNNIITSIDDKWAWIFWPQTKEWLKSKLKNKYLEDLISNSDINLDLLKKS